MLVDSEGNNKAEGKETAGFLRKSGLPKDVLRTIWIMAAKTDPSYLEKDEFYVALRLIALAQNNMEVSEESIRNNHPLPPLPSFSLRGGSVNVPWAGSDSKL
jgi:epidermal growth factor receptor substrate 15